MSEEASDLPTGLAPGKRPLDLSSNLPSDPDDSALAPKRAKIADENCRDDNLNAHNAMSNGGLDTPSQESSPSNNINNLENSESPAEPQPKYVAEAEVEKKEANGETENSIPSVQTNSEESASHNASSNASVESDTKNNVESLNDKHKGISDHHKETSNSPSVSDVEPNRTENDISGSCNGESQVEQSNNEQDSTTAKDSEKALEGGATINSAVSDDEAMDVDVENDSAEDLSALADSSKSEKAIDTSVPKDSLGAATDKVKDVKVDVEKADKVEGDVDKVDVEKADKVEGDVDKVDSVKADVDKADLVKADVVKADVVKADMVKSDVDKADLVEGNVDKSENGEDDMDTQDGGASTQSDIKDTLLESNQNMEEKNDSTECSEKQKESSEKSAVPEATNSLEEGDDFKENNDFVDCLHLLSSEQQDARIVIMKKLHEELRNEETKLLLLKKLRLSQQQPVSAPVKPEGAAAPTVNGTAHPVNAHRSGLPINMANSSTSGKPHASIPPQSNSSNRSEMPQLMRGTHLQQRPIHNYQKGHSGPPPLIMAQQPNRSSSSQSNQSVRAPVVRISTAAPASSTSTSSVSRSMQHQMQSSRQSQMANDGQTAASRQAAAKLALRKQLEKTLLQIPPPKPPPPELHFLPSAANNEFVILVGLEEVVNTILDFDKKDKNQSKGFLQPFKCAQCNTDFTTIWKQVKTNPKEGIMCESCIVSNQKKALKAEHTNRLKTAFVKALQQEQEIEQRIQSQASTPQSSSRVSSSSSSSSASRHRPPVVVHRGHGSSIHHSSSQQHKQRVMNPAPSQRVVQPIHYAYIPNLPVSAPQIQIIPKQHMLPSHRSSADRQREYLLDMIPPSKGLGHPQNPVIWKR